MVRRGKYIKIIAPIDEEAKIKDETFRHAYNATINELTADFSRNFLTENQIDWAKLVEYVSGRDRVTLIGATVQETEDAEAN